MKISEMTNEQLAEEFVSYDEMINKIGCFGTRDLMWLNAIEQEIGKRGGEIITESKVVFADMDEDEGDDE